MSSLKTKWGKCVAVAMAFALTVASMPGVDAQAAKKAKLAKTRLTIKVGKKKTIKIKNRAKKAKYTFKSKKASIAKVSKKGVVTARKAGSTTITVKEKLGKKTRKLGKVKVTVKGSTAKKPTPTTPTTPTTSVTPTTPTTPAAPSAPSASDAGPGGVSNPTGTPVVTDEPSASAPATGTKGPTKTKGPTPTPTVKPTPTVDPYKPQGRGWQKLDLSQWNGSKDNYLETGGQIVLSNVEAVTVPIPTSLEKIGDEIEVLIRGSVPKGSNGFRYWLTNNGGMTLTTLGHYSNFGEGVEDPNLGDDPKANLDPAGFKAGEDFQVQRVLEHINKDNQTDIIATKLLLKAPQAGGTLDGTTITGIWVRYGDDIGNNDEPTTPPTTSPVPDTSTVETPSVESYAVDFANDNIIHTSDTDAKSTKEVADGVTTFTMPQFTGFVFVLPEDKDTDAYKYVTITYQSTSGMMVEMFDENTNLSEPDTARDSATKHVIDGDGKFPASEEWKTVTYAVTDEFHNSGSMGENLGAYDFSNGSFKGIQIFNMAEGEQTLKIKSIVFGDKEPGSEEPGGENPGPGEEDPGPAWTPVDMSKVNAGTFDKAAGTLTLTNVTGVEFTLSEKLPAAGKLEVKLVGTDRKGSLFRCWAGGNSGSRTSNVAVHTGMFGTFVTDGSENNDFNIICNLTLGSEGEHAGQETNLLSLVKCHSWSPESITGTDKIDDIVFTSISYRIVDEFTNKK